MHDNLLATPTPMTTGHAKPNPFPVITDLATTACGKASTLTFFLLVPGDVESDASRRSTRSRLDVGVTELKTREMVNVAVWFNTGPTSFYVQVCQVREK